MKQWKGKLYLINERDQYLPRQPLDVLHVEERNIILLFALKTTTVGMLVINFNAFNFKKMFWLDSTILGLLSLPRHVWTPTSPQTYGTTWPFQWMMLHPVMVWLSGVKFRLENCPDLYNQQLTWAGSWGHSPLWRLSLEYGSNSQNRWLGVHEEVHTSAWSQVE